MTFGVFCLMSGDDSFIGMLNFSAMEVRELPYIFRDRFAPLLERVFEKMVQSGGSFVLGNIGYAIAFLLCEAYHVGVNYVGKVMSLFRRFNIGRVTRHT